MPRFNHLISAAIAVAALCVVVNPAFDETALNNQPINRPFGLQHAPVLEGPLWAKFRDLKELVLSDIKELDHCREQLGKCKSPAVTRFFSIVEDARRHKGLAKVEAVNRGVNAALRYQSDSSQYAHPDKWTSPIETFKSGRGDCEDYSTAKLVALYAAGMPLDHLWMVLGYERTIGEYHMVAGAHVDGRWKILENRFLTIFEDKNLPHFDPYFLINHIGVFRLTRPTDFFTLASRLPCAG